MKAILGLVVAASCAVMTAWADMPPPSYPPLPPEPSLPPPFTPDEILSASHAMSPLLFVLVGLLVVGLAVLIATRRRPDHAPVRRPPASRHATSTRAARLK